MDQKELLEALSGLVARYEQHRTYIEKARAQLASGKFNAAVIEKVVVDHEIKSATVADEVAPLLPQLRERIVVLDADKSKIIASKGGVDDAVQELELRNAIGELSDVDFEKEVGDLRESLDSANGRIAAIDGDLDALNGAVARWAAVAGPAGHFDAPPAAPAAPVVEEPVDVVPVVEANESIGAHGGRTDIIEDLSVLAPAAPATIRVEEEISIEAAEMDDGGADASVSLDVSIPEVEIDLGKDPEPVVAPVVDEEPPAAPEAPRRALLLYQEGTAEEQIYPFTGDQLTIGRGRNNDIQIKNDSKVSREHCKLFRRGNNFYIEDGYRDAEGTLHASSNGSLVNGELITERRLFGGEEVIIGETFFRFRIME